LTFTVEIERRGKTAPALYSFGSEEDEAEGEEPKQEGPKHVREPGEEG
jgi:hypothetical protein